MIPRPVETLPPSIIQSLTKLKWKYVSPANLATNGIYSSKDLDRLRNYIIFPVEKPTMINILAQGAIGQNLPAGSIPLYNMLDEKSLEKIPESAGARLLQGFITFGSASAGILAIFFIIRIGKLVVISIIRGYALHSIYGWSIQLLGTIWSTITHLLLQLGSNRTQQRNDEADREASATEMQPLSNPENRDSVKCSEVRVMNEKVHATDNASVLQIKNYGELNKYLETVKH